MEQNKEAYSMLISIKNYLVTRHRVPHTFQDSYRQIIIYCLPFYSHAPQLMRELQKSIPVRNRVCHFKPVTWQDVVLLKSICDSLQISQSTKVGMRR